MIIVIDSGSTKSDCVLLDNGTQVNRVVLEGLNPNYSDNKTTDETLRKIVNGLSIRRTDVEAVHFFGAGIAEGDIPEFRIQFSEFFEGARVIIRSDLDLAALATIHDTEGVAGILGTGSNLCLWDGRKVVGKRLGFGYILSDEGGGARLGKRLIKDYLDQMLDPDVDQMLREESQLTPDLIIKRLYKKPYPNRFLASFVPFIYRVKEKPGMKELLRMEFDQFVQRGVKLLVPAPAKVNLVGSVAFYFQDELKESLSKEGYELGRVLQRPLDALDEFISLLDGDRT